MYIYTYISQHFLSTRFLTLFALAPIVALEFFLPVVDLTYLLNKLPARVRARSSGVVAGSVFFNSLFARSRFYDLLLLTFCVITICNEPARPGQ